MSLAPLPPDAPTLDDVRAAQSVLRARVRPTPLVHSAALSALAGAPVHLKLETHQETGSFKLRGAMNRLAHLPPDARGVVAASTGNHGRAVAFAARAAGLRAVVCVSQRVPPDKCAAIAALGAELRIAGTSQDDALDEARRVAEAQHLVFVSPFDDPHVIAGQGTIGLELAEELPALDAVLVPLSGGGLLAGIALALKGLRPGVRVVGITMERGAAMAASLRAGRPVPVEEEQTLADSLGGGIGADNRYTLPLVQRLVDDVVLLSEAEIAAGMRHLYHHEGVTAEGAGAVGVAALLARKVGTPGRCIAVVVSGANVDAHTLRSVVE